ncbi:MAG: HAMP domain-containing histidine kinase [Defluviitaleaceae bacterium]|nr:HAMP domain-containing histidine kinase [Defluviitaleaceae bacterium]
MKWFVLFCVIILLFGILLSLRPVNISNEFDMLEVNRVVQNIEADWPAALAGDLPYSQAGITFLAADSSLHTHIQNQDTIVPVFIDGDIAGFIIFINQQGDAIAREGTRLSAIFYVQVAALFAVAALFGLYQYKTILRPFRKLEGFAARVAAGDLDAPLAMDKQNRFGAFTESFDLMREELNWARENERLANISKKELVASLSHDIKTPVASIKVIAELFLAKHGEVKEICTIINKADQIDLLVTNMFSATLEELTQLKVVPADVSTAQLAAEIQSADFKHKVRPFTLPECVLSIDILRFKQVVDNIIGNSYKYADTEIQVSGGFDSEEFVLTIRDFGPGVLEHEVGLLCEKFFRAENAANKSGTGLGLYLAAYFVAEMGGVLTVENRGGLCVVMRFPV